MTLATQRVLTTMLEHVTEMYGLQVCRATDLASGTVKPILDRLAHYGWATVRPEPGSPRELGRPLRRYYQLTEIGIAEAQNINGRKER